MIKPNHCVPMNLSIIFDSLKHNEMFFRKVSNPKIEFLAVLTVLNFQIPCKKSVLRFLLCIATLGTGTRASKIQDGEDVLDGEEP